MFELIFGTIWMGILSVFTYFMYADFLNDGISPLKNPATFIVLLFWVVGISVFIKGLVKIIKNIQTNKYGEECYGKICDVYESGNYVNGRPEYKADVLVYIPSSGETQTISETVGFNEYKYDLGSYLKLKYYKGDINFLYEVGINELPSDVRFKIEGKKTEGINGKNTITIDGVEYVRKDSIE